MVFHSLLCFCILDAISETKTHAPVHTCTLVNSLAVVDANLSRTVQGEAVPKIKEKRHPSCAHCADLQMFPFGCRHKATSLVDRKPTGVPE